MGLFALIVVGGLAGWVASILMKTDASMGIVANIVIGVIGALLATLVFGIFGGSGYTGFNVWSFVVAVIGSVALIALLKAFNDTNI